MTPEREQQLNEVLLQVAETISTMSYASRAKVGAILYDGSAIISMGWNGMPSGFPNEDIEIIENGKIVTNPLVLHAESNAILKCAKNGSASSKGSTLYVTMSPCVQCCKLIIQAGIKNVFYRTAYRDLSSLEILEKAGIPVVQLKEKPNADPTGN